MDCTDDHLSLPVEAGPGKVELDGLDVEVELGEAVDGLDVWLPPPPQPPTPATARRPAAAAARRRLHAAPESWEASRMFHPPFSVN
jgi:hypothetical protein